MWVVLWGWLVGDDQLAGPVVGEVVVNRMLLVSPGVVTSVGVDDLPVRPDGLAPASEPLVGTVIWRGQSVNGWDAAAIDCGFPVRVEAETIIQRHPPAPGRPGFRPRGWREWMVPVELEVPPLGSRCAVWGELRVAADHEMEDDALESGFPDIRRNWRIRRVKSLDDGGDGWLLDLALVDT